MEINNKKYSAIILAAGKSLRMGVPKFSLKFDANSTFLEHIASQYFKFGCEEIIVVVNPEGEELLLQLKLHLSKNVKFIVNHHPEWERFYSLKLGARGLTKARPTFVSNIDNPFISQEIIQILDLSSFDDDYVYPLYKGMGGHPFLISEKIVKHLIDEPNDQVHLKEFLSNYSKMGIEVNDDKVLVNINTEMDYQNLFPK